MSCTRGIFAGEAAAAQKGASGPPRSSCIPNAGLIIVEVADFVGVYGGDPRLLRPQRRRRVHRGNRIGHPRRDEEDVTPCKTFIPAPPDDETCGCNDCKYMKMVTLENICACLENESPEIVLDEEVRRRAERFDPEHDKYQITILYEETLFTDRRGVRLFDRCGPTRECGCCPTFRKMNIKEMKARGCKLSAEEIYSVNKSSLKDAIVIFGPGCTGEIVSADGLLFNQPPPAATVRFRRSSSVEHDYLKKRFLGHGRAKRRSRLRDSRCVLSVRFRTSLPIFWDMCPTWLRAKSGRASWPNMRRPCAAAFAQDNPGMEVLVEGFLRRKPCFSPS